MGARRNLAARNWISQRKAILQKIKNQVRLYLGEESLDLTQYALPYKSDIERPWQASSREEVFVCLQQVQVVFAGDFHPFSQSQRAHLRFLRKIHHDRNLIIAVECVLAKDQKWVDAYLLDRIDEAEFLTQTGWNSWWRFPWENYKPIFEFAKKNSISIIALNILQTDRSGESLHYRDKFASRILKNSIESQPDALFYTIYGDLHISKAHLPAELSKILQLKERFEYASVYLNSEKIYFELVEQGQEGEVEVVKFNDREFCLLSSPPWVKWQSYLMYLEENYDVDLEEVNEAEDFWDLQVDYTDHVSNLIKMICIGLKIQLKVDDIEVYSLKDSHVLKRLKNKLPGEENKLIFDLVENDRGFYVPQEGFFYLSKSTVNHAASLAGQYVHGKLCERKKLFWQFPDNFLQMIWVESNSFLLSKFVNPKRKAQTMGDLKKQLQAFDREDKGREPLLLALDQKMSELLELYAGQQREGSFRPGEKSSYLFAARFIGEMLGERYFLLYQKQILDIDRIVELLEVKLEGADFTQFYYSQLRLLDQLEERKKNGALVPE